MDLLHVAVQCLTGFILIPILGLCLLHCLINMGLFRRLRAAPLRKATEAGKSSSVSVLVPARNEEHRIRECLSSLIAQQPPVREIILLDDRSTDRTTEIARDLGFLETGDGYGNTSRLKLLHSKELPSGWVGKNWACHQLSQAADPGSSHLLFTDADTIHAPACVRTALEHALLKSADLLSLWPDQITGTWSEKLVLPLGYLLFMAFQPFPTLIWLQADPARVKKWRFSSTRLASLGAANGQFLLFTRVAYKAIGGHESLKDHLVEDIAFGRAIAARTGEGLRLVNADGIELLRCRMYLNFTELWNGFSKNLRPVFEESFIGFVLFGIVIGGLFLFPFVLLAFSLVFKGVGIPAVIPVLVVYGMRLILTLRFRTSWIGCLGHPIALALALLIAINSWRLCLGRGVSWKGRNYSGKTRNVHQ